MLTGMISSVGPTVSKGHSGEGSLSNVYVDPNDNNFGIGENLTFSETAENNIAIGTDALNSSGTDCDYNIAIGTSALTSVSTGDYNIAIGGFAGRGLTGNTGNTVVGDSSLYDSSAQINNAVVIGYNAMRGDLTTGADSTVAIGTGSLQALTDGGGNIGIGYQAMQTHTIGSNNIAIGYGAMNDTDATFTDNTKSADITGTTKRIILAGANSSLEAGQSVTGTGIPNNAYIDAVIQTTDPATFDLNENISSTISGGTTLTFSGALASQNNIFIGKDSGGGTWSNLANNYNVAIGSNTMSGALTAVRNNTVIGYKAGEANTHGDANVYIGSLAGDDSDDGTYNVAIGYEALSANHQHHNVAIGYLAGRVNTSTVGYNVFVGSQAGDVNTGEYNTIIGANALNAGTAMDKVTVIGQDALYSANNNAANGAVAIGWAAGYYSVPTGDATDAGNTLIGYSVGTDVGNTTGLTTGVKNTAVGQQTLGSNAGAALTGNNNTTLGYRSGYGLVGAANDNTFVGHDSGETVTTGDDNTLIGSSTLTSAVGGTGQIAIGKGVTCIADNTATLGIGANTASLGLDGTDTSWAPASSDERLKENIQSCDVGLAFINDLRPVTYNWKKAKDVPKDMPQYVEGSEEPVLGFNYGTELHGFIAQEVKEAIDKHDGIKDSFRMWQLKDDGTQTVADGAVIPMLIKAVQELSQQIEDLKKG